MCTDPKLCLQITYKKIKVFQGPFLHKRQQKIWRALKNWGNNGRSLNSFLRYCVKAEFWGLFSQYNIVTVATDIVSETPFTNYQTIVLDICQNVFKSVDKSMDKWVIDAPQNFGVQLLTDYSLSTSNTQRVISCLLINYPFMSLIID